MRRVIMLSLMVTLAIVGLGSGLRADPDVREDSGTYKLKAYQAITPGAPTDRWLYTNDMGAFELDNGSGRGKANYRWFDGSTHSDNLEFVRHAEVTTPAGVHRGWLYKGTDSSNRQWWLMFGYTSIGVINGKEYYPLYSCFTGTDEGDFKRWLTSGTARIKLP